MAFTVNLKVLSGFRDLKDLYELVGIEYLVSLSSSKFRRNVLDALRDKDNRLAVSAGINLSFRTSRYSL
jgi:hypothetical protein